MRHIRVYWVTCILAMLFASSVANATTIVMPTDEQLIAKSPVIIEGTVVQSTPVDRGGRIWTETVVRVTKVLKGSADSTVTIREIGGVIDNRITKIFGAPEYDGGEHVLLFLAPTPRGDYQTVDLFVGKFTEETMRDGRSLWARHDEAGDVVLLDGSFRPIHAANVQREAVAFEQYVQDRAAGLPGEKNYGVENPLLESASTGGRAIDNFTMISEPKIYRWFAFDNGGSARWYSSGTQPGYAGGGVNEVNSAMAAWNGYSGAKISYAYSGATTASPAGLSTPNGVNEILFNDPLNEISGSWNPSSGGVVGQGGFNGVSGAAQWTSTFTADATHTQGTFTAWNITEGNLTIQDNVSASAGIGSNTLAEIVAHEFGHTLGFGHSADGSALMYATVTGLGPALRADDQTAARWLYPNGSAPVPPPPTATIPAAPSNLAASISGTTVTLSWKDNAPNETGQSIYVASTSGGGYSRVGDVAAGATNASVSGFSAGSYNLYVVAFNTAGTSSASNIVTVTIAGAVQANFSVSPSSGIAGQTTFTFADQSSGSVASRLWQFGDGTTSTVANPSHVYAVAGQYNVILSVSGSGGAQSSTSRTLFVSQALQPLVASFTWSPAGPTTDQTVGFVDQSTGGATSWYWTFGDGTASQQQNPAKRFTNGGAYTVTLTVYRGSEATSASRTIVVASPAPAIPPPTASFSFTPGSPRTGEVVRFSDASSGGPTSWWWTFGDGGTSSAQSPTHAYGAPGNYTITLVCANSTGSSTAARSITVSPNQQTYRSLVPAAAQTSGIAGSSWRTELTLFNAGNESVVVQFTFLPGGDGTILNRSLAIGARQSATYANALVDLFGLSTGAGAIAVESTSTTMPNLRVESRTFTSGTAGTYGQAVPEVSDSDLRSTLYLTGLAANAAYRTNVGIVNRSDSPATATLVLTDASGGTIGATTVSVPARNFQQSPLSAYFPNVAGRTYDVMSMRVSASTPSAISVYASVVDNRTQDPVYVKGTASTPASSMILSAVGRTAGIGSTFWRSDVTIFNPGNSPVSVGLRYLAAGVDNRGAGTQSVYLGAGQTVVLDDIAARLGVSSGSGALQLTWNGGSAPVVTSRTYTPTGSGGTYGQSVDPVASFGSDAFVAGLRSDGSYRSNVGFVNSGSQPITVSISLLSSYGNAIASNAITLLPQSQMQYSLTQLFPNISAANIGSFTLQAHTDNGATMFAYGSMIDNTSNDPVFFAGR